MKRGICILLAAWLLAVPALADIIWEPQNSFYQRHQGQCERENRSYWTNSPEGYVTLRESPNGKAVANVKNGQVIYTEYRYQNGGEDWGLAELRAEDLEESILAADESAIDDGQWLELWFPMGEMQLRYDQQSFREDHPGEITAGERTVDVDGLALCYYEFPGGEFEWQMETMYTKDMEPITFSELYTDAEGREWGYLGYWYGVRNIWFCISDLENTDLPVEDHTPDLYPAAEGDAGAVLPDDAMPDNTAWVIAAVVLVCGVTAALLLRMKKRKQV